MTRRLSRTVAAVLAAFVFLGVSMILGAPSAAAAMVETAPPTPTLDADCQPVDPDPTDVWSYISTPDPVGGTTQVDAYVPEGHVIGNTGHRYWSSVEGVWEMVCPVQDTTVPVAPVSPVPPAPVVVDELAATGPADDLLLILYTLAAAGMIACGVVLTRLRRN